ncbi:MAG TPA: choice-of-anchor Q domain-containing protein, partial [Anaerolineales bacterium]|nr:choice-of-anchor Q domain-containing protein [Anaerolineales bacterium]
MFKRIKISQFIFSTIMILSVGLSTTGPQPVLARSEDGIKRQLNAESGKVSFIGPENGRVVSAAEALGTFIRPQDPAMALAKRFGPEFGLKNPERDLSIKKSQQLESGQLTVRYQQKYQGIPVMGGELIVNTNLNGDLFSINGEVSPDLSLSTEPTITSEQAKQTALQSVAKWYQKPATDFIATEPELWIYDESLLRSSTRPTELVWRMEVTSKDQSLPVRELVLVNAQRGNISLHFNQIDTAWHSSESAQRNQSPDSRASELDSEMKTSRNMANAPHALLATTWYVATTGNDANSCSTTGSPCGTINGAIGKAANGDTIKVATGTYLGTGAQVVLINKSITLSGGWNAGFSAQNGMSTINGQGERWGVAINSGVSAIIERSVVQNGKNSIGGGIYNAGGTLSLNNSTISGNHATGGGGGGIFNNPGGQVTLNNSTVSSNNGTGIYNNGLPWDNGTTTALTLNNSTVSSNNGTGIYNGGLGIIALNSSTVSNNTTAAGGGGIDNLDGSVTMKNTLLAGNSSANSGQDCTGVIASSGYNLIGNTSGCSLAMSTGDQTNVNPNVGPLVGTPGYHPLRAGSPAINAGNPAGCIGSTGTLSTDQRGASRVGTCDVGAYEYTSPGSVVSLWIVNGNNQSTAPTLAFPLPLSVMALDSIGSPVPGVSITFTAPASGASGTFASTGARTTSVNTDTSGVATTSTFTANNQLGSYLVSAATSGAGSVNFSLQNATWYVAPTGNDSNSCFTSLSPCRTINGAIAKAANGDTIQVASGNYIGTGTAVVLINKSVVLSGGWNAGFTTQSGMSIIDGQGARPGVSQEPNTSLSIERFVVQNGYSQYGGGIITSGSSLVLNEVLVQNNTCYCFSGDGGGGIAIWGGALVTVTNSTITGNYAGSFGGGIFNKNGTLTLNNSTISGNDADGEAGGGIFSYSTVTLNNTTVSGNNGGGIYFYNDSGGAITFKMKNSLVANNWATSGPDCKGHSMDSLGYNLIGNNSGCTFNSTTGDLVGTAANPINARINRLQDNGGVTFTHALGIGSPAVNAGNPVTPGSGGNSCLGTDQRRATRPVGGRCDIGAYEGSVTWVPSPYVNTYTSGNSSSLPGTLVCTQIDPNCSSGDAHAKAAHKYAIGTHDFFATQHDRISIDNNGMTIISSVSYCSQSSCPYNNAFWDGTQMVFGSGFSLADDVVAHEFTHGVTQYESNLFYFYQSGAINESFSDLWGEYYDQSNGLGNDTAGVKWLQGEDVSGLGAHRSMIHPPAYGDPDKMSSTNYYEGEDDSGGVHTNSGVNNKAVYLMVDGGTFNGKTVTALGWTKTAAIYYEVNTNLLSSGADYSDLYFAL